MIGRMRETGFSCCQVIFYWLFQRKHDAHCLGKYSPGAASAVRNEGLRRLSPSFWKSNRCTWCHEKLARPTGSRHQLTVWHSLGKNKVDTNSGIYLWPSDKDKGQQFAVGSKIWILALGRQSLFPESRTHLIDCRGPTYLYRKACHLIWHRARQAKQVCLFLICQISDSTVRRYWQLIF